MGKMKRYKLTKKDMTTHGGFQWKIGKTYLANGEGDLCGKGWLHFYTSPLLAVLLNPTHANIVKPRLFLAECGGKTKNDHGLKIGHTKARLIKELPMPIVTPTQRVAFGILCAQKVYNEPTWAAWAAAWLEGDRTVAEAARAARAAWEEAWAAERVAAAAAARAARAAVAAAEAEWAAERAAETAAAWAARAAAASDFSLDKIAEEAIKY